MKKILLLILLVLGSLGIRAQEFDKQIAKAKSAYEAGNYEESRFAVQNALLEINIKIGQDVLALLPEKVNSMSFIKTNDQITGSESGYAGLFIARTWGNTSAENLSFSVLGDSPLLAGVNAFLALPLIMVSSDSNQKKIKVEGYRALLEKKVDGETGKQTGYDLMVPYGKSMIQLTYTGEISEVDFLNLVKQIPVAEVTKITQ